MCVPFSAGAATVRPTGRLASPAKAIFAGGVPGTVTRSVAVAPLVEYTVMFAVPGSFAVTRPLALTSATSRSSES